VKPATYTESVEIVKAYAAGTLKTWTAKRCMTYHCAMMRLTRFRREYPEEYARLTKC